MADVRVLTTAAAAPPVLQRIRRLLVEAFDGDFSEDDWKHALGGWHVLVTDEGAVAHAAVVPRTIEFGERPWRSGYVEAVATAPSRRGEGLGSLAMTEAGEVVRRRFEVGVLSTGRHGFYERLGWERWRGPSFVRHGDQRIRTPDEDDGIMVLRFGPGLELRLTDPIVCQARSGDDW
ncbi:MAG TPA: GNAT family N-acetyltransferase [Nitriliruptorales bacterium]|nr:GNAT family N-acetyltransferase [Nitriliruptorales bacterium]